MSGTILGYQVRRSGPPPGPRTPQRRDPALAELFATRPMSVRAVWLWGRINATSPSFPLQPVDAADGACVLGGISITPERIMIQGNEIVTDGQPLDAAGLKKLIAWAEEHRVSDRESMVTVWSRKGDNGEELERVTYFARTPRMRAHYAHTTAEDVQFYDLAGNSIGGLARTRADRAKAARP